MTLTETLIAQPPPLRLAEGGQVLRVGNTGVPLDTVVYAYDTGATPEEIALNYPSLKLADVYAVIAYYLEHREDVEAYLTERRDLAQQVRQENEVRFPSSGLRERLLARRNQKV